MVIIVFRRKHAVKYRVGRPPSLTRHCENVAARRRRGVASGGNGAGNKMPTGLRKEGIEAYESKTLGSDFGR